MSPPSFANGATPNEAATPAALRRAWPLVGPGAVCVTAGGLIAAGVAHAPTSTAVWLAAYLVLVSGVAQITLALGQALLATPATSNARVWLESLLFNIGSAGVIAGTLGALFRLVVLGTGLFLGALGAFVLAVPGRGGGYAERAYQALIALLAISAGTGLALSASGA